MTLNVLLEILGFYNAFPTLRKGFPKAAAI